MGILEKRISVNPIVISLGPSVNRVEYLVIKDGIKMIYAIKADSNLPPAEQFGTFIHCVYQPKAEVVSKT